MGHTCLSTRAVEKKSPVTHLDMRNKKITRLSGVDTKILSKLVGSHLLNCAGPPSIEVDEVVPGLAEGPAAAMNEINAILGNAPVGDVRFALHDHLVVLRLVSDGVRHLLEVTVLCTK